MCQSKQCRVEGCENKKKARGLCNKHYTRFSRYGTHKLLHEVVSVKGKPCEVNGCKETQKAKGLCQNHYMRQRDEEIEKLEKLEKLG